MDEIGVSMQVRYETRAIKDLKAVPVQIRDRVILKILQYASHPASQANNVKHLTGSPFHRLRVGDYRVIFCLDGEAAIIMTIIRVRHRREAYD